MVTNINLVSPEEKNKPKLSGRTSLALSISLLVVAVGVYFALGQISNSYQREKSNVESQIQEEKAKISGPNFSDVADFQGKLNLLEKIIGDHVYLDGFLKNLSKFVLPEVRFTELQWDYSGDNLSIKGIAPNFDSLSREIILLKNCPLVESIEFKNAAQSGAAGTGQVGVQFEMSAEIKKEAYNK